MMGFDDKFVKTRGIILYVHFTFIIPNSKYVSD